MPGLTAKLIKKTFWELLREMPYSQITVKAIVKKCEINRNTFYYHYENIPALLDEVLLEFFDELIKKYPSISSIEECCREAFQSAIDNKSAILHLWNSINRDVFEKHLMYYCEDIVVDYLQTTLNTDFSEKDKAILLRFLKCALFGLFNDWLNHQMPEDAIEEVMSLLSIIQGLSPDIIEKYHNINKI